MLLHVRVISMKRLLTIWTIFNLQTYSNIHNTTHGTYIYNYILNDSANKYIVILKNIFNVAYEQTNWYIRIIYHDILIFISAFSYFNLI